MFIVAVQTVIQYIILSKTTFLIFYADYFIIKSLPLREPYVINYIFILYVYGYQVEYQVFDELTNRIKQLIRYLLGF